MAMPGFPDPRPFPHTSDLADGVRVFLDIVEENAPEIGFHTSSLAVS